MPSPKILVFINLIVLRLCQTTRSHIEPLLYQSENFAPKGQAGDTGNRLTDIWVPVPMGYFRLTNVIMNVTYYQSL